jgi:hypothetical protein
VIAASALLIPSAFEGQGQAQTGVLDQSRCTPLNVAVFTGSEKGRIHIQREEIALGSISFYALATFDLDADRMLGLLEAAITPGKQVDIVFNQVPDRPRRIRCSANA